MLGMRLTTCKQVFIYTKCIDAVHKLINMFIPLAKQWSHVHLMNPHLIPSKITSKQKGIKYSSASRIEGNK